MRALALICMALLGGARAETLFEYAGHCAREVARVPAFSCQAGQEIPISVDGKTPARYLPNMDCDRPSLLPNTARGGQGQCLPGSRALVLRDDAQAQISAICRRLVLRAPDSPLYDEINVIAHSLTNGKTCWFTAKAAEPLDPARGIDGRWVPAPGGRRGDELLHGPSAALAGQARLQMPAPDKVWLSPRQVAAIRPACIQCHDSGPFMYSPYIAQTQQLPGDPFGRYRPKALGADFRRLWAPWNPHGISTRGNSCTGCHRIGNLNSCQQAMAQATGRAAQPGADAWAQRFAQSHWMAPGALHSRAQWEQIFARSLNELQRCCSDPQAAGCLVQRYD